LLDHSLPQSVVIILEGARRHGFAGGEHPLGGDPGWP
jgi:hypothetical protein